MQKLLNEYHFFMCLPAILLPTQCDSFVESPRERSESPVKIPPPFMLSASDQSRDLLPHWIPGGASLV